MSTLIEYKVAIRRKVELDIFGPLFFGFPEFSVKINRTLSDFDDERLHTRAQPGTSPVASLFAQPDQVYTLQPGAKMVQLRTWTPIQDVNSDGNAAFVVARSIIVVHRALMGEWDAPLYENNEMLEDQQRLVDQAVWRALAEVDTLVNEPVIDSVPTRVGNVISYQLDVTTTVTPD